MAFVEGGAFKCSAHDVETESISEWNKHCKDNPAHTESGETLCIQCGQKVFFEGLPFHPINEQTGSKNISLRCEECEDKNNMGSVKRTSIKQVEDKELI